MMHQGNSALQRSTPDLMNKRFYGFGLSHWAFAHPVKVLIKAIAMGTASSSVW
ncbi:hypothetical protein [Bacteroides acidifaciens]|uniref:hypothetical protein n=1 Tax=Bacteroides acidifaciens TaxID=85831 RepID=UPI003F690BDE